MSPAVRSRASKPSADGILEAAEKLFATAAYGDVSLRQLIAATGVSTTAFYARFESKDAVLIALAERFFTDLNAEAARSLGAVRDIDGGVARGIEVLCDHLAGRKALVRLIVAEAGSSLPTLATRRRSYGVLVAFLAHRLAALAARGRIVAGDPEVVAWALVGAIEMQIVRWAVWEEIDMPALRVHLLATARAVMPRVITEAP